MHSDKDHPVSSKTIIKHLNTLGMTAERKEKYHSIDVLNHCGVCIRCVRRRFYYEPTETDLFHVFMEETAKGKAQIVK